MKLYFSFLLICLAFLGYRSGYTQNSETFRIVGYYSLDAAMSDVDKKTLKRLTHVNLWFLNPDSTGNFTRDLSGLTSFVAAAHDNNVKVLFSIGGGSKQAQYKRLLQDEHRPQLIKNLVNEVIKYNIDGIDVDLEGSDIDDYYEPFVLELSAALKQHSKLITAAIAIYYKDQFTDKALNEYDFVNVMSYDRTGPWRPEKPGPHSTYEHAVEDLDYFGIERKIPREKMTLGVPFYGYGFDGTGSEAISMNYQKIVTTFKGAEDHDQLTMPDGKILYYNGIPTMKKKTLLASEKASGIMIWQVLGDTKGKKSLLRTISRTAGK